MRQPNRLFRHAFSTPAGHRRRNRWRADANTAGIERLEDRTLLSCDVMLTPADELFVRGDDGPNDVRFEIVDDIVRVQCDGRPAGEFTGVARIDLQTFGGDDCVSVHGTQTRTYNSDLAFWGEMTYQLGTGADHFTADLRSSGRSALDLRLQVDSGGGDNTVELNVAGSFLNLAVEIETGDGNVALDGFFVSYPGGLATVAVHAGAGVDDLSINAIISAEGDNRQRINPDIEFSMNIDTAAGDDAVDFSVIVLSGREISPEVNQNETITVNLTRTHSAAGDLGAKRDDNVEVDVAGNFQHLGIAIDTGGGDDVVSLNLHDVTAAASRMVIDTGDGDDTLNVHGRDVLLGGQGHDWRWSGSLTAIYAALTSFSVDRGSWNWTTTATGGQVSHNLLVDGMAISNGAQVHWGSPHPGGVNAVLMDGSVRGVSVGVGALWSWAIGGGVNEIDIKAEDVLVEGQAGFRRVERRLTDSRFDGQYRETIVGTPRADVVKLFTDNVRTAGAGIFESQVRLLSGHDQFEHRLGDFSSPARILRSSMAALAAIGCEWPRRTQERRTSFRLAAHPETCCWAETVTIFS
jgi:prepilin-type processing-associated H-X9-DG protein